MTPRKSHQRKPFSKAIRGSLLGLAAAAGGLSGCADFQDARFYCTNKVRAVCAYGDAAAACPGTPPHDYKKGWIDGYYDVLIGGGGLTPATPPNCYLAPEYQTPSGRESIEQYFRGFQDGVLSAQKSGYWVDVGVRPTAAACPAPPVVPCPPAGLPAAAAPLPAAGAAVGAAIPPAPVPADADEDDDDADEDTDDTPAADGMTDDAATPADDAPTAPAPYEPEATEPLTPADAEAAARREALELNVPAEPRPLPEPEPELEFDAEPVLEAAPDREAFWLPSPEAVRPIDHTESNVADADAVEDLGWEFEEAAPAGPVAAAEPAPACPGQADPSAVERTELGPADGDLFFEAAEPVATPAASDDNPFEFAPAPPAEPAATATDAAEPLFEFDVSEFGAGSAGAFAATSETPAAVRTAGVAPATAPAGNGPVAVRPRADGFAPFGAAPFEDVAFGDEEGWVRIDAPAADPADADEDGVVRLDRHVTPASAVVPAPAARRPDGPGWMRIRSGEEGRVRVGPSGGREPGGR